METRGAAASAPVPLAGWAEEAGAALCAGGVGHLCAGVEPATVTGKLARTDPSPVVRLYLASAAQRLPLEQRWEMLEGLVARAEDAGDHNLPLMDWYAAEPLADLDRGRAFDLAAGAKVPLLCAFAVQLCHRRAAAVGLIVSREFDRTRSWVLTAQVDHLA